MLGVCLSSSGGSRLFPDLSVASKMARVLAALAILATVIALSWAIPSPPVWPAQVRHHCDGEIRLALLSLCPSPSRVCSLSLLNYGSCINLVFVSLT